jgi:hypothetical protein
MHHGQSDPVCLQSLIRALLAALPEFKVWVTVHTIERLAVTTDMRCDHNGKSFVQSRAGVSASERGGRCVVCEK